MAFATLGAAEILERYPNDDAALALVGDTAAMLDRRDLNERWPWPENRLTYANAVLPEALLIAGLVLENFRYVETSLRQLRWLIDIETVEGVLNVISVGGTGPYEEWRQFDQQPIEAAALADACWRAWQVTGDVVWRESLDAAIGWFLGDNAMGVAMYDAHTGGGFDGLTSEGVNLNQGAESTLALIATLQHANRLAMVAS